MTDENVAASVGDEDPRELTWAEIAKLQQEEFDLRLEVDLPEEHFISEFVKWMQTITDGYPDYAITCAIWILSAIASPKVTLKLTQQTIVPNLWFVNLGKSTTSRKSTSINKTRGMYETATDAELPNEDYSMEGYLETLSINPVMNNVRDEVAGLMAKYHKKYNEGIIDLECVVYDCGGIQKTLASGRDKKPKTFKVKNPRVTKLYATTPTNFSRYMTIDDFTCGYGIRFLFTSPAYKHARKPLTLETKDDIHLWASILARIKTLWRRFNDTDGNVNFTATPAAMAYFDEVCQGIEEKADTINNDMLNAVIGRSEVHILKLAMLFEIGRKEVSTEIGIETMQVACDMVTGYFIPCIMTVIDGIEDDAKNSHIEKIISILKRLGGTAKHTKLLRNSHLTSRDFTAAIDTMIESLAISAVTNTESKAKVYRLLSHNGKFAFRNTHKTHNVRTYTQVTNSAANFANVTRTTPYLLSNSTCEPCEFCESCEDPTVTPSMMANTEPEHNIATPSMRALVNVTNHRCGRCDCELTGQTFQGPAGQGMICADCQAELDRQHGLSNTIVENPNMIKNAIFKIGYVRGLQEFTPAHIIMEMPKGTGVTTENIEQFMVDHTGDLKIERTGNMWRQVSG